MKRFVSMLLLCLMVMSTAFIVGCGPKDGGEVTPGEPEPSPPTRYDERDDTPP